MKQAVQPNFLFFSPSKVELGSDKKCSVFSF